MFMGMLSALFELRQYAQLNQATTDLELANWAEEQYSLPQALRTPIRIDTH